MSRENVAIVRRAFTAALVSEPPDAETLREVLDPDVVVTSNWGADGAEDHHGVEGTRAARAEMSAIWDSWEQELERILDAGDKGAVMLIRFRAQGRGSGVPVEFRWAMVSTLRNARIVTSRTFLARRSPQSRGDGGVGVLEF